MSICKRKANSYSIPTATAKIPMARERERWINDPYATVLVIPI